MNSTADRIVIAGAGPVGLVVALRLAEAAIPCVVLEANEELSDDLRASTFHPPTLDMLDEVGLTAPLVRSGLICPRWQVRMHATGERAEFDLSVLANDTAHPYRLQCEQARLCALALSRVQDHPLVDVRFGCAVTGVRQLADRVHVVLATGEVLSTRFLIGADGASSTVRDCIGLRFAGTTFPETTVLASTPFPFHDHLEGIANVSYCWSEGGNFALLRLRDFWRASLYYSPELSPEEAASEPRIQEQLRGIVPGTETFEILDRRPYRVHQRIVDDYRVGRVFLAGDAAHVNSPSGGMGMNGGIHDAWNLSDKLAAVWRGADGSLLDLYTAERRLVAERQILHQAARNRDRMAERDPGKRLAELRRLQDIAADPVRARDHLLATSMITGLRSSTEVGRT